LICPLVIYNGFSIAIHSYVKQPEARGSYFLGTPELFKIQKNCKSFGGNPMESMGIQEQSDPSLDPKKQQCPGPQDEHNLPKPIP
jgi:hypothetical protein